MRRAMVSKALWHAVLSMWLHFPACVAGILLRPYRFFDDCFDSDIQSWQHMRAVECHLYDRSKITGFQLLPFCTLSKRYKTLPGQGVGLPCLSWNHSPTTSHNPIRFQLRFFNYDERRDSNISLWQASDECRCPIWSYTIGSSVFLFSSNAFFVSRFLHLLLKASGIGSKFPWV